MNAVTAVPQMIRNAGRLHQVISVLTKYGVAQWLRHVPLQWVQSHLQTSNGVAISDLNYSERVREAITEVGTTFIKLGQILSTRPDVVGVELAEELSNLQSKTPPDDAAQVKALLERELGRPIDEVFSSFDEAPLASASIGQVHRATLLDGSTVVVKIQHSGIEEQVRNDLEIARELARLAAAYSTEIALYQPVETVEELGRTLLAELDFQRELRNLQIFRENFKSDSRLHFPRPYPEFSTKKILTMELLEGIHVRSAQEIAQSGHEPEKVVNAGANAFLQMVFRDGFFHADPHPGNLLLLKDGRVGVIDCGMVGRVDDLLREQIEDLMIAAGNADVDHIVDLVVVLGDVPPSLDRPSLCRDVAEYFDRFSCLPLNQIVVSEALTEAVNAIRRHQIRLPTRVAMLIRMIAVLEGTGTRIAPDFQLLKLVRSYSTAIFRRRLSPRRLHRQLMTRLRRWTHLMDIAPGDLADILERVKQGSFDVHLEHRRLDSIVNRLVLGIISAALFIGSSLLWSRNVEPQIGGYSLPGMLGTGFALMLTFRVLRAVRTSEKR